MMLNLPILLVLVRQREKSQEYFSLLPSNWNLNHSNLLSTLGATNFSKWELLSGSPGSAEGVCAKALIDATIIVSSIKIPSFDFG